MEAIVSGIAGLLKKSLIVCVFSFLLGIFLYASTNLISSDPCLNDWDVQCTSAVGIIETVNSTGLFAAMASWVLAPFVVLFLVLSWVLEWFLDRDHQAALHIASKKQTGIKKSPTKQTRRRKG